MENVKITPKKLSGFVAPPPSKSMSHRALITAALSACTSTVENIELSQDIMATLDCVKALGIDYRQTGNRITFKGMSPTCLNPIFKCHESGSTLRFFMPIATVFCDKAVFFGSKRLLERPLQPYVEIFKKKNIHYSLLDKCVVVKGKLTAGDFSLPADVSSQFISGLLLALPHLQEDSEIHVEGELQSVNYVDLTLHVLNYYGIKIENQDYKRFYIKGGQKFQSVDFYVEGDYSQAAFFFVASAIGNDVECPDLRQGSLQGDKKILDILKEAGALVDTKYDITVTAGELRAINVDAGNIPDLVPILAVLCCFCEGKSVIYNAARLRIKESDRLDAITTELNKLGAKITQFPDKLEIEGVQKLTGGTVSGHNDHRIAMALAIAATRAEGEVIIKGSDCVLKSYPNFWQHLFYLGAEFDYTED